MQRRGPRDPAVTYRGWIEPYRGGFLVRDGHHNRVYLVTRDGDVSVFRAFDNIVPTGLALSGDRVYMAQAGPLPHLPQDGKVVSFTDASAEDLEAASGAPLLVAGPRWDDLGIPAEARWAEIPSDRIAVPPQADGILAAVLVEPQSKIGGEAIAQSPGVVREE